jgi:hypothetical protein
MTRTILIVNTSYDDERAALVTAALADNEPRREHDAT